MLDSMAIPSGRRQYPFRLINACSIGPTADPECVEKKLELHRAVLFDVPMNTERLRTLTNVSEQRS